MNKNAETNSSTLLSAALLLTISLLGFSLQWERVPYVFPLGNAAYAPLLFIPLFLVSLHALLSGSAKSLGLHLPVSAIRTFHPLVFTLLVFILHPADPAIKLGIGTSIIGTTACLVWAFRVWKASNPPKIKPHESL